MDYVTPNERVNPRQNRFLDWCGEIMLRWKYRIACFELEKQNKHAAEWLWVKMVAGDKLKELGINPEIQPEPLFKHLEVWFLVAGVILALLCWFLYAESKATLIELIQGSM